MPNFKEHLFYRTPLLAASVFNKPIFQIQPTVGRTILVTHEMFALIKRVWQNKWNLLIPRSQILQEINDDVGVCVLNLQVTTSGLVAIGIAVVEIGHF